ncbi:heavy metal-binding domain-containing protein [Propionibacteriaceae bacterium G57]|uniref:heavy metal-binding domain-containing protein n=1 Tax=Aestuariimicrobium sp. G57 TaxID=3418485 RepID=UPI003DA6FB5D
MSNPPYGNNPYGQNPYGQPQSQPSAGWGPNSGAGNQPPQQPGWGQPGPQWGQPQQPQPPQQPGGWGAPQRPGQPPQQHQPGQPGWGAPQHSQSAPQQPGQQYPGQQYPGQPQQGQVPPSPVPPSPVPEPEPRRAVIAEREVIVATTEAIPGHEVHEILGEVIGVVTRPRDMRAQADLAVILTETRQAAVTAMVDMATRAGADAVIGLRFDGGKISDGASEVTAYGTAVKFDGPQRASDAQDQAEADPQGEQQHDQPQHDQDQGEQQHDQPQHEQEQHNPFTGF